MKEKWSRSAIESPIDALKDAAMFSEEGEQMKIPIMNLNADLKKRD